MEQRKHRSGVVAWLLIFSLVFGMVSGYQRGSAEEPGESSETESESSGQSSVEADVDVATLRLIFTSDIHGQLTTEDYEGGKSNYTSGGYCRTVTLIEEAKKEVNEKNSLLFDLGDNLYDYTTDFIYNYDSSAPQPIFAAIAKMNYDAITLGNHEFEYDLDYIKNQLKMAGLTEKVVLSNVWDAVTKKHVWTENKILTRKIVTEAGKEFEVKVGIIGETVPGLSIKRTDYTGILETEDIVANVKKEAAALKEQGADVVVVIAHSGIGGPDPDEFAEDTGYALTQVDGVDAVLCGHRHKDFPLKKNTTIYDNLPDVDPEKGLIHGKPVAQVKNRGASLGVVDLKVAADEQGVRVVDGSSEIRKVNAKTKVNQEINACVGDWSKIFISDWSEILCDISSDAEVQNYFGTIEDTDAIQLLNDIKMSFGLYYTRTAATDYKEYPVVAASSYFRYGSDDIDEYIDISGQFKRSGIYSLVQYKTNQPLYEMTGAQIREWLEWSAGCYETAGKQLSLTPASPNPSTVIPEVSAMPTGESEDSLAWKTAADSEENGEMGDTAETKDVIELENVDEPEVDTEVAKVNLSEIISYHHEKPLQYALQEECIGDWSRFYVFDGVDYTIDTSVEPRYDAKGNKIRDTRRITSLTRNGEAVKDDDLFIVVADFVPSNALFNSMDLMVVYQRKVDIYRQYVESYLKKLSQTGGIQRIADQNWKVKFSADSYYLLRSDSDAEKLIEKKPWLLEMVGEQEHRRYYLADFSKQETEDTIAPSIHAVVLDENITDKKVPVYLQVNDVSGVSAIKYAYGRFALDSEVWNTAEAKTIANQAEFTCDNNGMYSIYAVDTKGNARVSYLNIFNINRSVLAAPVVETYTNRKNKIKGTAEANATIYFALEDGKIYSTKVGSNGKFTYELPVQQAGKTLYAYVVDDAGKASARTLITVKRTGPNKPTLNPFTTSSKSVSGVIGDTYAYPMLLVGNSEVYVPNENVKMLYSKSDFYEEEYSVKVVDMNIKEDGSFSLTLPNYLEEDTFIELVTVDVAYRCSLYVEGTCQLMAPNKPTSVSSVTNLSKSIQVYTDQMSSKAAVVEIGSNTYTKESASYDQNKKLYCYTVPFPRTDSTQVLSVYLKNAKGKSTSVSVRPVEKAPNLPKINAVKAGKKKVTGKVDLVEPDGVSGAVKKKAKKVTATEGQAIPAVVSRTQTEVFVFVNNKKYQAWIDANGKFTATLKKPLAKGDRITCKAKNAGGTSLENQVVVK